MGEKKGFKSAEVVSTAEGRQYHIGLAPGEVAPYILMCGDPARAHKVAGYFDEAADPISHREYVTITGKYKGIPLSVMATGMGPDNTEIAVIELAQIVKKPTFIRIGTSGSLQKDINIMDLVISTGAVRLENTSTAFVVEGYPAVANYEIVLALQEAANKSKYKYHLGLTGTGSGFYGVQGRRVPGFPPRDPELPAKLGEMNVANLEMESSCLFTLSTLADLRAGTVCAIIAERHTNVFIDPDDLKKVEKYCIEVGLSAFEILSKMDKAKGESRYWIPSMKV